MSPGLPIVVLAAVALTFRLLMAKFAPKTVEMALPLRLLAEKITSVIEPGTLPASCVAAASADQLEIVELERSFQMLLTAP